MANAAANMEEDKSKIPTEAEQSPEKSGDGDQEFEPTADMLVHDYDDEQTLAEEEAIAIADGEDPQNELSSLQKESDMPIEQLMALYYGGRGKPEDANPGENSGALPAEDVEEEMEEDLEDEEDDDSMESTSSSSAVTKTELPTEAESLAGAPSSVSIIPPIKLKTEPKSRSDLHLLYEEGTTAGPRLRSGAGTAGATASDEEGEEEEDGDYAPGEDEWRKTIMIGSEYQASVPSGLSHYDNIQTVPYENEDKLLWSPWKMDDQPTEEYLQKCAQIQKELMHNRITASSVTTQPLTTLALLASIPMGAHTRDDEQALHQLLQCGYNVEEAVRRRKMSSITPSDTVSLWSEEECRNFESGLRVFGKDFHHIQAQRVRTRSVGELVQFYYLWKKTERHDVLANRARLEKKKYALHPGTTDYMDRFLDEQEVIQNQAGNNNNTTTAMGHSIIITRERSNSRSSSPNVHSLIFGDPKRLRVSASTPPAGDDGGANGLPVAGDEAGMLDGTDESSGQVLSAAAAAAAAAATVLPPPSDQVAGVGPLSNSRDLIS